MCNFFSGDRGFKGDPGVPGKTVFTPLPERPQVAFSVTMDEDMPRAVKYRVVKFSIVLSNLGGAYDAENGIFNTPINGTYVVGFSGVSYHGQVSHATSRDVRATGGVMLVADCEHREGNALKKKKKTIHGRSAKTLPEPNSGTAVDLGRAPLKMLLRVLMSSYMAASS